MIIDLTQSELSKQMDLGIFFSDSIKIAKALVLAKAILPSWYYEDIKKELLDLHPTRGEGNKAYIASLLALSESTLLRSCSSSKFLKKQP